MSKRVRLRVRYHRRSGLGTLLVLALLVVAFLAYLDWNQHQVAASGPHASFSHAQDIPLAASSGMRQYYLTITIYNGANADGTDGNGAGVCVDGYHFASLWEIVDPSNLKYDTDLGVTRDDSGQGPPSYLGGWVRTGYSSNNDSIPGWGNCDAWASNDSGHRGTFASLPRDWTAGGDIYVWEVGAGPCDLSRYVWCVADKVGSSVYLPSILKNSS